jgi:hypothetical protein
MINTYLFLSKPNGDSAPAECADGVAPSELFSRRLGVELKLADDLILQDRIPIYSCLPYQQDLRNCFDVLAAKFTQHLSRDRQLVIIVDEVDLRRLNPLRNRGWESLVAMLIQAFPEVRWIFGKIKGCPSENETDALREQWQTNPHTNSVPQEIELAIADLRTHWEAIRDAHAFSLLFEPMGSPLFDGSGLRHWIRTIILLDSYDNRKREAAPYLPKRKDLAVVLDEERDFRDLHALMAYGRGLRVKSIESWSEARHSLGVDERDAADERTYDHVLTVEDIFLNYPDQTVSGMSNLDERVKDQNLPLLAKFQHRRFVTVGHNQSGTISNLEIHLRNQRLKHLGRYRLRLPQQLALKPAAGIYSLWKSMGLHRHLRDALEEFEYQSSQFPLGSDDNNHSSPGRLLEIAECLIARAKKHRAGINSVSDAVYCAMLAIQAYELLGGLTPVLSHEALTLRHEFEVTAECQFSGVQHHLDVRSRMIDIQQEVQYISRYFGSTKRKRKIAALNAELAIVGRLVDVLRKYDQFDEERILLTRLRQIHRKLFFADRPLVVKPLEILPAYAERLLTSFPLFVVAIFAWIAVIGFAHSKLFGIDHGEGLAAAFFTFIGIGSSGGESVWKPGDGVTPGFCMVSFTVLLGFVHLGIFISYLNTIINRK